MSLMDTGLFRLLSSRMSYQSQRMAVLSQNVANANTPGYKAKDLTPFTFAQAMEQSAGTMAVTNAQHMLPGGMMGVNAGTKKAKSYETVPSGNSVDLEQQMMDVSKTSVDYQSYLAVYHKVLGLFKTAAGVGK